MKIFQSVILFVAVGCCGCSNRVARELEQARSKLQTAETELRQQEECLNALQAKYDETSISLAKVNLRLTQAREAMAEYAKQISVLKSVQSEQENRQGLIDSVPASFDGKAFTFPKLVSPTGVILLTNAEYQKIHGRKLVFKSGLNLEAFDVDALHSGVLLRLGIDSALAKENQSRLDKAKDLWYANIAQNAAAARQSQTEWQASWVAQQAKLAAEQAKQRELDHQQRFEEDLRQQQADSDRIRAKAMMIQSLRQL
jgi:hypothetical protein